MNLLADQILTVELNGRVFRINKNQQLNVLKDTENFVEDASKKKPIIAVPNASFKVLADTRSSNFKMPTEYFVYHGHEGESDKERVEYDIDREDTAWLKLANERRKRLGQKQIKEETFELAIDRLEKESHFQISSSGSDRNPFPQVDNDAACCICNDADDSNVNQIIFCDMCNIPVHQECYGVPYIPEGQWLCRRCQLSPSVPVSCVLCPYKFGAFKQTSCGQWAHVICALWINEVHFANVVFNEPIEGVSDALKRRSKLRCIICRQKVGACLQCSSRVCRASFHVTCAVFAGFYMEVKPETARNAGVGRFAYCQKHYPEARRPDMSEAKWKRMVNRKILNAKTQVLNTSRDAPQISIPVIPPEKVNQIGEELRLDRMEDICYYWALKRRSRFGVPLIRRLQVYQSQKTLKFRSSDAQCENSVLDSKADDTTCVLLSDGGDAQSIADDKKSTPLLLMKKKSASRIGVAGTSTPSTVPLPAVHSPLMVRSLGMGGGVIVGGAAEGVELTAEQVHVLRLRANLERVRLLCELVKKREKFKREFVVTTESILDRCTRAMLGATLDNFVSKDLTPGTTELSIALEHLSNMALLKEDDLDKTAVNETSTASTSAVEAVLNTTAKSPHVRRNLKTVAEKNITSRSRPNDVAKLLTEKPLNMPVKRKSKIDDFFTRPPPANCRSSPSTSNIAPRAMPAALSTPAARYAATAYRIRRDGGVEERRRRRKSSYMGGMHASSGRLTDAFSSDASIGDLTATSMDEDDEDEYPGLVDEFSLPASPLSATPCATPLTPSKTTGRRRGALTPKTAINSSAKQRVGALKRQTLLEATKNETNALQTSAKRRRRLPARPIGNEFDSTDPNIFAHNDIVWAETEEGGARIPARVIDLRMRAFLDDGFPVDRALRLKPHADNGQQQYTLVMLFDLSKTWKWIPTNRLKPCDVTASFKSLPPSFQQNDGFAAMKRARQFWNEMLRE